jgi:Skp family chaperone for outer membrane proteins
MNRQTIAVFAVAVGLCAVYFTGTTVARSARYTPDNKIATVNMQAVFDNLAERKDKLDQLQAEAAGLDKQFGTINEQINQQRAAANAMPDGPAKDAAVDAVVDRDIQTNIEAKKAKSKLEKAQAAAIRAIFDKIQKEAGRSAALNGFTMVMAADDTVQISPRATAQEATQLMSLRRFLYIEKQHDITADVLSALNNAYNASKPKATPAPAAPGTAPATPNH